EIWYIEKRNFSGNLRHFRPCNLRHLKASFLACLAHLVQVVQEPAHHRRFGDTDQQFDEVLHVTFHIDSFDQMRNEHHHRVDATCHDAKGPVDGGHQDVLAQGSDESNRLHCAEQCQNYQE